MANQRGTFAKRQREQDRKDRARMKEEKRATRRAETPQPGQTKGPQIAWDEEVRPEVTPDVPQQAVSLVPDDDAPTE